MKGMKQISENRYCEKKCAEIFENLHFAHIRTVKTNDIGPIIVLSFAFLSVFITAIYLLACRGEEYPVAKWVVFGLSMVILLIILIVGTVYFAMSKSRKRQKYFLKTEDGNMYEIRFSDSKDRQLYSITHFNKKLELYFNKQSEWKVGEIDENTPLESTCLYQFATQAHEVLRKNSDFDYYTKSIQDKRETKTGRYTYYWYPPRNIKFGAKYQDCVALKDGKIRYVAKQRYSFTDGIHASTFGPSYKHIYSHVNDSNYKIKLPMSLIDVARYFGFDLPDSENIVYV